MPTAKRWSRRRTIARRPAIRRSCCCGGPWTRTCRRRWTSLQPAYREAVWLRDVEQFSYEEIAGIVGVPIGTVMSRISRGRRALYDDLVARSSALRAACGRRGRNPGQTRLRSRGSVHEFVQGDRPAGYTGRGQRSDSGRARRRRRPPARVRALPPSASRGTRGPSACSRPCRTHSSATRRSACAPAASRRACRRPPARGVGRRSSAGPAGQSRWRRRWCWPSPGVPSMAWWSTRRRRSPPSSPSIT